MRLPLLLAALMLVVPSALRAEEKPKAGEAKAAPAEKAPEAKEAAAATGDAAMAPPEDKEHPRCVLLQGRPSEDGKSLIVYLNGGHKKKFKKGAKGHLLRDPKGDALLPGGEFTVTMVVDSWNTIARIEGMSKMPKVKRCYLDLTTP